jgi:DMSO/TMAO reductase YedYZ molybdopterin-dependent catalytic subunit
MKCKAKKPLGAGPAARGSQRMNALIFRTKRVWKRWLALAPLLLLFQPGFAADANTPALMVQGAVEQPFGLSMAEFRALPRTKLNALEKDGRETTFEGVGLWELVKRAKPRLTEKCCGNAANACVIVQAADNYRVVFSLLEIDPDYTDQKVMLAARQDGKPLSDSQGPLRLVVPAEKVHTRWVRQVRSLEVVLVEPNKGRP